MGRVRIDRKFNYNAVICFSDYSQERGLQGMTTKTRVISDTHLNIDKNIKHRDIYKGVKWKERESARRERLSAGVRRVSVRRRRWSAAARLSACHTDEMRTMTSPRSQRLTQNIKFTLNFASL
jgi:hypothetical protein